MTIQADEVDDLIAKRMQQEKVIGLSLAIVHDGKIVKAQGYGFTDKSKTTAVTPETLFQAGSVSKPVAALGALYLVEKKALSLDDDANKKLFTWKVPDNSCTKNSKATLRGILSHSAGFGVHGFSGYSVGSKLPGLAQILDGGEPANSEAIRVEYIPGSQSQYSGGGYTVMQQMMVEAAQQPFPDFMDATVLKPFGMVNSTYKQPLPVEQESKTATGYYASGNEVYKRWHIYPEMAAAGLWTTASDLACFEIGIQQIMAGKSDSVISPSMAREMLTEQIGNGGLGLYLKGEGEDLIFFHGGVNDGFNAEILSFANKGQGVAVMINSQNNHGVCHEIIRAIGKVYGWW